jgi:hypothetical protein
MTKALRIITALPGILFLSIGLRWLFTPATVAAELKMPMLEGMARSSQIGDLGSFFTGMGLMILIGVVSTQRIWLFAAAILVGGAAFYRTMAWIFQDAALATESITIEVVVTVLVLATALRLKPA